MSLPGITSKTHNGTGVGGHVQIDPADGSVIVDIDGAAQVQATAQPCACVCPPSPQFVIGGDFGKVGGVIANGVARYNEAWSHMDDQDRPWIRGVGGVVSGMDVGKQGGDFTLHIGGTFSLARAPTPSYNDLAEYVFPLGFWSLGNGGAAGLRTFVVPSVKAISFDLSTQYTGGSGPKSDAPAQNVGSVAAGLSQPTGLAEDDLVMFADGIFDLIFGNSITFPVGSGVIDDGVLGRVFDTGLTWQNSEKGEVVGRDGDPSQTVSGPSIFPGGNFTGGLAVALFDITDGTPDSDIYIWRYLEITDELNPPTKDNPFRVGGGGHNIHAVEAVQNGAAPDPVTLLVGGNFAPPGLSSSVVRVDVDASTNFGTWSRIGDADQVLDGEVRVIREINLGTALDGVWIGGDFELKESGITVGRHLVVWSKTSPRLRVIENAGDLGIGDEITDGIRGVRTISVAPVGSLPPDRAFTGASTGPSHRPVAVIGGGFTTAGGKTVNHVCLYDSDTLDFEPLAGPGVDSEGLPVIGADGPVLCSAAFPNPTAVLDPLPPADDCCQPAQRKCGKADGLADFQWSREAQGTFRMDNWDNGDDPDVDPPGVTYIAPRHAGEGELSYGYSEPIQSEIFSDPGCDLDGWTFPQVSNPGGGRFTVIQDPGVLFPSDSVQITDQVGTVARLIQDDEATIEYKANLDHNDDGQKLRFQLRHKFEWGFGGGASNEANVLDLDLDFTLDYSTDPPSIIIHTQENIEDPRLIRVFGQFEESELVWGIDTETLTDPGDSCYRYERLNLSYSVLWKNIERNLAPGRHHIRMAYELSMSFALLNLTGCDNDGGGATF